MKKLFLILIGMLSAFAAVAKDFTYSYRGQILTYTIIDNTAKTCRTKTGSFTYSTYYPGNLINGELKIPAKAVYKGTEYSVVEIGDYGFCGCGLKSVEIPSSVKRIGANAFEVCYTLESISVPGTVTIIGNEAFRNCHYLQSIDIPASLASMGDGAFSGCTSVTSITIPNTLTEIPERAFEKCISLTTVEVPASVRAIRRKAFTNCIGMVSVTIPSSVTVIGPGAFYECRSLASVEIPPSVTEISDEVFYDCSALGSIVIPPSVTKIGVSAFESSGLISIEIPSSVTEIADRAFHFCSSAVSLEIPSSVAVIGEEAFSYCTFLNSVYYNNETPVSAPANVFENSTWLTTLYVPEAAVGICRSIDPWKKFSNIVAHDFTGIHDVDIDADAPMEVYGLGGVKAGDSLDGLAPGVYVVRQGGKVHKVAVK